MRNRPGKKIPNLPIEYVYKAAEEIYSNNQNKKISRIYTSILFVI